MSAAVVLQQSQWHKEASDHINDTQALVSILLTLMSVQPQQCPTVGSGALSSHCCAGCMLEQPCRIGGPEAIVVRAQVTPWAGCMLAGAALQDRGGREEIVGKWSHAQGNYIYADAPEA